MLSTSSFAIFTSSLCLCCSSLLCIFLGCLSFLSIELQEFFICSRLQLFVDYLIANTFSQFVRRCCGIFSCFWGLFSRYFQIMINFNLAIFYFMSQACLTFQGNLCLHHDLEEILSFFLEDLLFAL